MSDVRVRRVEALSRELSEALRYNAHPEQVASLVSQLAIASATAVAGECESNEHDEPDYPAVRPVLGDDGKLRFCCTGDPPHCSEPLA